MHKVLGDLYVVLKKLGVVLVLYSFCRFIFYAFNKLHFDSGNIPMAFLHGIRFDLSAIAYMNAPFVFFALLPFSFRNNLTFRKIANVLFISINSLGILLNLIDSEFFTFQLKRSTFDFFDLFGAGDDMGNLLPQYLKDYWYLIIVLILMIWVLIKAVKIIDRAKFDMFNLASNQQIWTKKNYINASLIFVLMFALMVITGRGGLQLRPLSIINATNFEPAKNAPLILNTPFTMLRSMNSSYIVERNYFDPTAQKEIFSASHQSETGNVQAAKENVVVIVLESFSYEYLNNVGEHGQYLTPFLDSIASAGTSFPVAYANGKKSLESVPSICSSVPSLMNNPFIFSPYSANEIDGLPSLLANRGYNSAFYHGGINGTMGFNAFAKSIGYEKYLGKNEYPNQDHYDGTWGIYDEYFYSFFEERLRVEKEPFTALFFSLSSHHPYKIPDHLVDQYPTAEDPYENVVQYGDYALKQFFRKAQSASWFDNTLFVITADHTAPSEDAYYNNRNGFYRVPLIFYHPTKKIEADTDQIAQHIDILPTVIDYLNIDQDFVAFGQSLLSGGNEYVYQFIGDVYQIVSKDFHLEFDGEQTIGFYNLKTDKKLGKNLMVGTAIGPAWSDTEKNGKAPESRNPRVQLQNVE